MRISILSSWLLLCALSGSARAEPPVPLLWKAEAGAGTVWLLGSFHALRRDDYPLDAQVEQAFADAETVVFELAPEQMQSPQVAATAQRYARFEDGRSLSGVLSETTRQRLQAFLGSEAALAAADPYEPWYMGMNLAVMTLVQAGFDPSQGLDLQLMQRAAAAGKATAGLEGIEDQLGALDAIPLPEQDHMLGEALQSIPELRSQLEELHGFWRSGDAGAIERGTLAEMRAETPVAYRRINVERNQRWLPQIEAMLRESDDHLLVVGSLHLLGEDGLVAGLRARGIAVERVGATR